MQLGHGYAEWKLTRKSSIEMDMQHGHGHAAWTWIRCMDVVMQHRYVQWALKAYSVAAEE